jgi:maleate isomerase
VREVAPAADAVLIWSTNLPGYLVAAGLEAELDVPILDSASVGVWACLTALGLDPSPAAAFGRIFTVTG